MGNRILTAEGEPDERGPVIVMRAALAYCLIQYRLHDLPYFLASSLALRALAISR